MIEIISPKSISSENILIDELRSYGMDYFDINSWIGWNYILDHVWLFNKIKKYLANTKLDSPTILDIGCGNSPFHDFTEKKLGINIIGIDRPVGYCHQEKVVNADHLVDFLECDLFEPESVDVLFWLSSIEHNELPIIKKLYNKSFKLLKPGGILLITFPLSKETAWFEDSQQTNISTSDSCDVFNDTNISGEYNIVVNEYKSNMLFLKDRYTKRYGHFDSRDPQFIVAGVDQVK